MIYPWLEDSFNQLQKQRIQHQFPHALLIHGAPGLGKRDFVKQLMQSLLCHATDSKGNACGRCHSCQLLSANNHPDFISLMPEEKSVVIKIDQVRQVTKQVSQTAKIANCQVVVIDPAEAMNTFSANALLKTLEEPSSNTFLMLISEHISQIPATINSRCQKIFIAKPTRDISKKWLSEKNHVSENLDVLLNLAQDAPLKVLRMIENDELTFRQMLFKEWCDLLSQKTDPISLASAWSKKDPMVVLDHLILWVSDLLRIKIAESKEQIINSDWINSLDKISQRFSKEQLYALYDELLSYRHLISTSINLNAQLLLEKILIDFASQLC